MLKSSHSPAYPTCPSLPGWSNPMDDQCGAEISGVKVKPFVCCAQALF